MEFHDEVKAPGGSIKHVWNDGLICLLRIVSEQNAGSCYIYMNMTTFETIPSQPVWHP
jgi:hypothetical protein